MGTRASALLFALLAGAGCIMDTGRGVPLYDLPTRPKPDQVATLGGYVAAVDGRDVSKMGGAFELLPGCHVVTTPTNFGSAGAYGLVSGNTGVFQLPIAMVAGHHYLVVASGPSDSAPTGVGTLDVSETDAAGHPVEPSPEIYRKICPHRWPVSPAAR